MTTPQPPLPRPTWSASATPASGAMTGAAPSAPAPSPSAVPVSPAPSPPAVPPSGPGAVPPAALAASVLLVLEVTLLAMSLLQASSAGAYLASLLGLDNASVPAPAAFTVWDVGCCALLVTGLAGLSRARPWAPPVLISATAVLCYAALTGLAVQFSSAAPPGGFTAGHTIDVNVVLVAEALVSAAALLAAAARARAHRP
jgi:hypothetical protein